MSFGLDNNRKYIMDYTNAEFVITEDWMSNKATGSEPDTNYSLSF